MQSAGGGDYDLSRENLPDPRQPRSISAGWTVTR